NTSGSRIASDSRGSRNIWEYDLEDVIYMLRAAVEASSDHDGWIAPGEIGSLMVKIHADFDT
ncbi:hypothetical protein V2A60_005894, partial [Cordyceps javanica]